MSEPLSVVRCPQCQVKAFRWADPGPPWRKCHACGHVWDPTAWSQPAPVIEDAPDDDDYISVLALTDAPDDLDDTDQLEEV